MPSSSRPIAKARSRTQGKRALAVWVWVLGLCLAVLIATYMIFVESPPPRRIVIATGGQNGAYFRFARKYAEDLQKVGLSVEVRETAGSVENLRLLGEDDSGVSVAIVQSGVAGSEELLRSNAQGSLYREPLWVFYPADRPLERPGQLAGGRIGVGPPGSGTDAIALQLLAANGLTGSRSPEGASPAVLVQETVAATVEALQGGKLDAAFFVAAFEADYIQIRFLSRVTVPAGLVDLGRNIPAHDVALVAPTAVLVSRKDIHPALMPLLLTRESTAGGMWSPTPGSSPPDRIATSP